MIVIADEMHRIKNPTSQTTKIVKLIRDFFKYRFALTATPWPNNILDIWPIFYMLDPSLFGEDFNYFKEDNCKIGKKINGKFFKYQVDYVYEHKEKIIREKIKKYILRRKKTDKDVKKQLKLPDQNIKKIYVKLSEDHLNIYYSLIKEKLFMIKKEKGGIYLKDVKSRFPFLSLICSDVTCIQDKLEIKNEDLLNKINKWKIQYNEKLNICDQLINQHKDEKIILWSTHPKTIDNLYDYYSNKGKKVIKCHGTSIKGQNKEKKINELLEKFTKKDYNLAILSPLSLGVGHNMTESTVSIWWDRNFSYNTFKQGMDRNYRGTSIKDVYLYLLIAYGTMEESQDYILTNKEVYDKFFMNKDFFENRSLKKGEVEDIFKGEIKKYFNNK